MMTRRLIGVPLTLLLLAALGVGAPLAAQETDRGVMGQGTEDRDWVEERLPDPTASDRFDFEVVEHVKVQMRDGVRLDGVLYLPDLPDGPGPCVLVADGYGWEPLGSSQYHSRLEALAARGYAAAHVTYRGIDRSEGVEGLYHEYGRDGYDVVEWMARQDWCDGNVGMFGSSLVGLNQWQVAKEAPPSLRAIVPDVGCGNCYEYLWYRGGMMPGTGREARSPAEHSNAVQHRNYDGWWRDRTTLVEDHRAMARNGIAALVTGGWQDYITAGNIRAFEDFAAAGGEGMLMLHPGAHSPGRGDINGPYHYDEHKVLFFDRHLRGEDNGYPEWGGALIWINGPDRWRHEETWPIPDARTVRLHLRSAPSGSISSLNDGSLSLEAPDPGEAAASYEYTREDGPVLPTMRHSGNGGITRADMSPWEEEALTWTTAPLEAPTEVTGTYRMEFWAEVDSQDTDFVLMVSDVAPDGTSRQVTSGYLNAPRAVSRTNPSPLTPGEARRFRIEAQPMSHVFAEGHRIRFSLAGATGNVDDDRSGSPQGPAPSPYDATVIVHQGADYPATVEFPVIGTAEVPAERGR